MKVMVNYQLGKLNAKDEIINKYTSVSTTSADVIISIIAV